MQDADLDGLLGLGLGGGNGGGGECGGGKAYSAKPFAKQRHEGPFPVDSFRAQSPSIGKGLQVSCQPGVALDAPYSASFTRA